MDALRFLDSVAGFTRAQTGGSADRPVRFGTVDAAYTTGNPRVTFDGESTMSTKRYPYLNSYLPVAGDRVVLLPAGTTYLIVGRVDTTVNNLVARVAALETFKSSVGTVQKGTFNASFVSTSAVTGTLTFPVAFASTPVLLPAGVQVGANADICVNWTATPTTTQVTWRAFQSRLATVPNATAVVHWVAFAP